MIIKLKKYNKSNLIYVFIYIIVDFRRRSSGCVGNERWSILDDCESIEI